MAAGRSTTRPWLPYTSAVTAGLLVIAGAFVLVREKPRTDCAALEVTSSTEKVDLLRQLAKRYNDSDRSFGADECATVNVNGLTSGKATEALAAGWSATVPGLPEPQVWLPTSTLWTGQLRLLNEEKGRPAQSAVGYPSIANSPLVIAMPREKAELLRQQGALGWGEILGLSGRDGWAEFDKPEWGRFTFGKDNPNLSTSGLAATIATYYAAINRSSDLTEADLGNASVTQFVRRIEANVSHYSDDVVDLLSELAEADLAGAGAGAAVGEELSAVVTQEELVHQYNEGKLSPDGATKPRTPLVALYPKEGTFNLDHPYVVLPTATEAQRAAADDFRAFLTERPQQEDFAELGFRDHQQVAAAELLTTVGGGPSAELTYFAPPDPTVVEKMLVSWGTLRKKANVVMAIDTSGSMNKRIEALDSQTRFQVATAAATKGLDLLNSEDRVGLWSFSSETRKRPKTPFSREVPLSDFDQPALTNKIKGMNPEGATALYATVRAAHREVIANHDPERINAVVVLTDGYNEYTKDQDLARLLRDIKFDPDKPVKIFCIAFDQESDFATLDKIAKASSGKAFDARDPATIDEAFVKLVSSF